MGNSHAEPEATTERGAVLRAASDADVDHLVVFAHGLTDKASSPSSAPASFHHSRPLRPKPRGRCPPHDPSPQVTLTDMCHGRALLDAARELDAARAQGMALVLSRANTGRKGGATRRLTMDGVHRGAARLATEIEHLIASRFPARPAPGHRAEQTAPNGTLWPAHRAVRRRRRRRRARRPQRG